MRPADVGQGHDALTLDRDPADFNECGLVFSFRDAAAVASAEAVLRGEEPVDTGVGAIRAYLAASPPGDTLLPLFPDPAGRVARGTNWTLVIPHPDSEPSAFATIYLLRLANPGDGRKLGKRLAEDPLITSVHAPATYQPLLAPDRGRWNNTDLQHWLAKMGAGTLAEVLGVESLAKRLSRQWGLKICGFDKVWDALDTGDHPGEISVIDAGTIPEPPQHPEHPELRGRFTNVGPRNGEPQAAAHALEVAGVISAIREEGNDPMLGCCSASLRVYNVFNENGFDCASFYHALKKTADDGIRVVNLSIGSTTPDPLTEMLVRYCIEKGTVVVAAMGDRSESGNMPVYPAAFGGVIAVGGADRRGYPSSTSRTGAHICITAPGEGIYTLTNGGGYLYKNGTSYATAMVSAAAWLALRKCRGLTPGDVRTLLQETATGTGTHSERSGFGLLNMEALKTRLERCA